MARLRVLVLAALALTLLPAAAHASLRVGVQDDALLTSGEPNAWLLATSLAPGVVRYNVGWEHVAPQRPADSDDLEDPAYDWRASDGMAERIAELGAVALFSIVDSPGW